MLCDYIADLNSQGKNAHHLAIEHGHLGVLKTLIAKKPTSPSLKEGNLSLSLLGLCVRYSQKECLNYLLSQTGYRLEESSQLGTLLHVAIHFGQFNILKLLVGHLEAAPLLQKYDEQGRNPLALAAFVGDLEAVEFLYKKVGNSKGYTDWTAAHWAVTGKQGEVLKLLDYLGMNLDIRDAEGRLEDLLKEDTSFEANKIKNILKSLIENRDKIHKNPLDFRSQPPEGIVFKGGGPRGLAYLEALRALKDKGALDKVQRTAGTSAGALTAAIFALDPQLKDIDSLENLDLMQFLDPIKGKEPLLNAMLAAKDKEGVVSKILSGSFEVGKEAWNPLKLHNAFSQLKSLCEGENLRKWIEEEIHRRTGKEYCTFGELKKEIQRGKNFLHLHVYTTRLEAGPDKKILHLSSEDSEWDNIVISDAIRASMSIPGVYPPYTIREKTRSNTLVARTDLGPCVDGGLIKNFPIDAFDIPTDGYYSSFNRRTLGLCLKDIEETKTPPVSGILDITKACATVYWNAEEIYVATEENRHRTIEISIQGVGLCDFNMTQKQKANLLKAGRESIENDKSPFAAAREPDVLDPMKISNVPTSLPFFTGRQQELRSLKKTFTSDPPSSNDTIVRLIYGLGGMGKTELTRAFARKHQQDFSIIWFINSATPEERNQSYRELAEKLHIPILDKEPPEQIEIKVHARLQNHTYDKPWLLIYDNVEEKISVPQGGYVLMTSRNRDVWTNTKEWIQLEKFEPEESLRILEDITEKRSSRMPELAKELGHFPLALNQAAHYIRSANCSIEEYLTALKKKPVRGKMERDERYKRTLQNVWHITLEKLEQENPKASAWLKVCAHLNPDDIPQEWLTDWLGMQPGAGDWDKMEITKTLEGLSLLRSKGEEYSMHRLMQLVVCETAGIGFEEAFELVSSQYQKLDAHNWKRNEKWVAQACSIEKSEMFENIDKTSQINIFKRIGLRLSKLERYQEALGYLQRVLMFQEATSPPYYPDLAISYHQVGWALKELARNEEALMYQCKGVRIREKIYPPNHLYLVGSYNNLGLNLIDLKQYPEALELHLKVLKIRQEIVPPNHHEVAKSYNNVGLCFSKLERHSEALEYRQKGLEILEKMEPYDPYYLGLAASYNDVSASLREFGQHQKALEHLEKALKIRKVVSPPYDRNLANTYNEIGITLRKLGRNQEALEHLQKALKIRKEALPPYHEGLAISYHCVGLCLIDLGRCQEALVNQRRALKIWEKAKSPDYPLLAEKYSQIGANLIVLGKNLEALEYSKKALGFCVSQENSPNHELYLKNYIHALSKQLDAQLIEKEKQEMLALYIQKLGEDHPFIQELKKAQPTGTTCILF